MSSPLSQNTALQVPRVAELAAYLLVKGWKAVDHPNPRLLVFQGPVDDADQPIQLVVPRYDTDLDSHHLVMKVVKALSIIQDQSIQEILDNITKQFGSDSNQKILSNGTSTPSADLEVISYLWQKEMNVRRANIWGYVEDWLQIDPDQYMLIDKTRLHSIKQRVREYAQATGAAERIQDLDRLAQKIPSNFTKLIVTILGLIAGAPVYSRAMFLLLITSFGTLALPLSFLGGVSVSFVLDWLATKSLTNYSYQSYIRSKLEQLGQSQDQAWAKISQGEMNSLIALYWHERINGIEKIEVPAQTLRLPANTLLALLLSLLEYMAALFIVRNAFGPIDPTLNEIYGQAPPFLILGVAAALPVILTWAAAYMKAQNFGLPEYVAQLIPLYQPMRIPPPELSGEQLERWITDQVYLDGRLNAAIEWIINEESILRQYQTPAEAELAFDRFFMKPSPAEDPSSSKKSPTTRSSTS